MIVTQRLDLVLSSRRTLIAALESPQALESALGALVPAT
jgi:hypothetical protein